MFDNIKLLIYSKSIDKCIAEKNYDLALEKLNYLITQEYKLSETFLRRGKLCHKLLMLEDAYSDFTYIITHCAKKEYAYYERLNLNFEIANFYEAVMDADKILTWDENNFNVKRIKLLSLAYLNETDIAKSYITNIFESNKYKSIQFLFKEVAQTLANDELSKALKLLELIELIDPNNPIKLLKEATIYGMANEIEKQKDILKKIDSVFPKYFISHFRFSDMYKEKDLMEIYFLLELKIFDKQNLFAYPMSILEGYKNYLEGHIIDAKESFEKATKINPNKPEAYVLLAQTLQLMSGYDNPEYKNEAEKNYKTAMEIYRKDNLNDKVNEMRKQLKHLNSSLSII